MTLRGSTADAVVLVFARAPQPGRAKTRLIPRLGPWGAARLQGRLTENALRIAGLARVGPVELHVTPRATHASFRRLSRRFPVKAQGTGDLGERMHAALAEALRRHFAAILIGTDCPSLRPEDLRRALRWLRGGSEAVLAPAEDGGYGLIGLTRASPRIFENVEWGGADVYARTRANLTAGGFRWRALRTVWDIDRPEDLERLAARPLAIRSLRSSSAPPPRVPR